MLKIQTIIKLLCGFLIGHAIKEMKGAEARCDLVGVAIPSGISVVIFILVG